MKQMIALAPMKSSRYYFFKWKQYHKSQSFRITMRDAAAFRNRRVQKGVLDHWHLLTATGGHWAATRERMYRRSQRGESLFASTSMTVSESSYRRDSMVRHTFSRSEVKLKVRIDIRPGRGKGGANPLKLICRNEI